MAGSIAILWAVVAGPSPFAREEAPREERWGTVWLSDGSRIEGSLYLTLAKPLTLYEEAAKEWKDFKISELERVRLGVEKAEEVPVWRCKEGGSDEKIRTGESYPNLILWCEVVTASGERVRGHVLGTVLYVKGEKKNDKVLLKKYVRGKVGQGPEQVIYAKEIIFHEKGKEPPEPPWLKK